jgi:tRNA modification GTPase
MAITNDTIAAIATPPGRGGVGIVRLSGPDVPGIARKLFATPPEVRKSEFKRIKNHNGELIDEGIVLYFAAPHSFTGEHVLELQGHGGPVVLQSLLDRVCELGARPARPGEFSERAFFNDKLDLAQAEAIADLIDAGSRQAARAALRSLEGDFSVEVEYIARAMLELRMYVEAAIDFPEEEIDFLADDRLSNQVIQLQDQLASLLHKAEQGARLRDGLTVVIAGAPNAGKSSILNRLAGREAAIVTEIAGTTRDVLREEIVLDGLPLHVIDTAGLRKTTDPIEKEGIRRAQAEIARADLILLIIDASAAQEEAVSLPAGIPVSRVVNKIDLVSPENQLKNRKNSEKEPEIRVSAKTGAGFEVLSAHIRHVAGLDEALEGSFSARSRHLEALRRAQGHVERGFAALTVSRAGELLAEELRLGHAVLGEITGKVSSDELLGEIFSRFCIGK